MPPPGDQHKDSHATTNPFLDQKPHIAEYTAQEIATLQSRLEKQLGPEYISTRPGAGGGKVHYLEAPKVISLANEVFGFNGWSSQVQNVQIDFVDEHPQTGKITLGLSTIVRVTLRDGTFHEDIGYGHMENCKGKAAAFEKAKKEAVTDALKRALRNFGNVLGNCLYDKEYLQKVTKVKAAPSKWDADNLHRHPDYAPIKREATADAKPQVDKGSAIHRQISVQSNGSFGSMEFEDDFGGNPFEETEISHPDEVRLDDRSTVETPAHRTVVVPPQAAQQRQSVPRMHSMPQIRPPNIQTPPQLQNPQPPQRLQGPPKPPNNAGQAQPHRMAPLPPMVNQQRQAQHAAGPVQISSDGSGSRSNPSSATAATDSPANVQQPHQPSRRVVNQSDGEEHDEQSIPVPRMPPPGIPEGFVTGRSAELINQPTGARPPNAAALAFNPHADSPSIRRTQGVNPGRSAPVSRQALTGTGAPNDQQPLAQATGPQHEQAAQQGPSNGMNGVTTPIRTNFVNPSADMNRRIGMPPSVAPHAIQNRSAYKPPTKRPPLQDVSNLQQMDGTGDPKKAKLEHSEVQPMDGAPEAPAAATT